MELPLGATGRARFHVLRLGHSHLAPQLMVSRLAAASPLGPTGTHKIWLVARALVAPVQLLHQRHMDSDGEVERAPAAVEC